MRHFAMTCVLSCAFASSAFAQDSPCAAGSSVEVRIDGEWYPATIQGGPNETGQCHVAITGWEDDENGGREWADTDRIRPIGGEAAVPPTTAPATEAGATEAPEGGPCAAGSSVEVRIDGEWYPATIQGGPNETGQCYVAITGWEDDENGGREWADTHRIR